MRASKVTAYFQGHMHTLEHAQESGSTNEDDIHYFTVGSGALLDFHAALWALQDDIPDEWRCDRPEGEFSLFFATFSFIVVLDERDNGATYCHFGWFTKDYDGGFAMVNIAADQARVKFFTSNTDELIYEKILYPRK